MDKLTEIYNKMKEDLRKKPFYSKVNIYDLKKESNLTILKEIYCGGDRDGSDLEVYIVSLENKFYVIKTYNDTVVDFEEIEFIKE